MQNYGHFGKPCIVLEMMKDWQAEAIRVLEAKGIDPFDPRSQVLEAATNTHASPIGKADFAAFFDGPVTTNFYVGYDRAEGQYRRFAMIDTATDFKEKRIKGLNGITGFGYVGDLGEYPGLRRSLRPEASIAVDTYGGVLQISRQAIRNDDTKQILTTGPDEMGFGAGTFVTETIVALIVSNPLAPDGAAMYSVGRGNSVAVVLDENSLVDGTTWMQTQKNDDGRPIRVKARSLVVQNDKMGLIARRVLQSQTTGVQITNPSTQSFPMGTDNAAAGILPPDGVVVEPFMPDANDWYLFADPDMVPAFAISFLDGQEKPFIGLKDPYVRSVYGAGVDPYTFELDSLDYKARFDFGAAPVDPRGTYRGTPA